MSVTLCIEKTIVANEILLFVRILLFLWSMKVEMFSVKNCIVRKKYTVIWSENIKPFRIDTSV